MEKIIYKTKNPISLYFCIISSIIFAIYAILNSDNFWGPFFYIFIFSIIIYLYLANYSGKLILTDKKIIVRYSIFRFMNIELDLKNIIEYDYVKGFYDLGSNKGYGVNNYVPKIFYDSIIFITKIKNENGLFETKEQIVRINTRMYQLDKFLNILRKNNKIRETAYC